MRRDSQIQIFGFCLDCPDTCKLDIIAQYCVIFWELRQINTDLCDSLHFYGSKLVQISDLQCNFELSYFYFSPVADEGDPKIFGAQNFIFSKSSIGTLDAKSTSCTLVNVEHFYILGFF